MSRGVAVGTDRAVGYGSRYKIASTQAERDLALDLVKGVLVVVMVAYHAMNIFSTAGPDEYAYVRFVSGSFILMSGYIVAKFCEGRFEEDWFGTSRILIFRGLKLIILFIFLNLLIDIMGMGNIGKGGFSNQLANISDIYIVGKPGVASFQILLPIGYILVTAPTLLLLGRFSWLLLAIFVAMSGVAGLSNLDSVNIDFVLLGGIGLFGGLFIKAFNRSLAIKNVWVMVGCFFFIIISMRYLNENLATYALGIIGILKVLYDLSSYFGGKSYVGRVFVLLGQYSLVCYIVQIGFMRALHVALSNPQWPLGYEVIVVILVTVTFLVMVSAGLVVLRDRNDFVRRAYKLVFL